MHLLLELRLVDSNEKLLQKLKHEFLAVVPENERALQQSIYTSHIRSARISSLASKMTLQKGRVDSKLESALLKEYKHAVVLQSQKAKVFADLALFDYYAAIESDAQYIHITRAKKVSELIPDINTYDKQQIHTKYATTLYQVMNDFEGAYKEYESLFQKFPGSRNNIYPVAKYIQICLILSRTVQAKVMLDYTFKELLHHDKYNVAANAALNYAKYYTLTQQHDNALAMIQKGMNLLKRKLYVQYEIEFRNLQTAVLVMRGDTKAALTAIERNLKYLRSKGFKSSNSDFHEFYSLLRDYVMRPEQIFTTKLTQSILKKWSKGIYNIYGALLKHIIYKST